MLTNFIVVGEDLWVTTPPPTEYYDDVVHQKVYFLHQQCQVLLQSKGTPSVHLVVGSYLYAFLSIIILKVEPFGIEMIKIRVIYSLVMGHDK